jgi:hypothetical protein
MAVLIVPPLDDEPWPSLGGLVCDLIEDRAVFGPGSLKGRPAVLDPEKRAAIYRCYEVYPRGHPLAGRRRFKRAGLSWRKGTAKTEFAAWVAFAELHPEGPVRFDGWDARGNPVGRPVADPYVPMVAFTEEQTERLAYGALYTVVSECGDADLFDIGLERIIRLDARGRPDGLAEALSGSPDANDGARTTFQHFDEPHRMHLPRLLASHETMLGNLPKRPLEDPWSLETTTAGEPGQGSVAENTHAEARAIQAGEVEEPELFYFHREAGPGHDMSTLDGRVAAVAEATGPVGEYAPGQFREIARQWDRKGADKRYLERVWLNRWVASERQAFDPTKRPALLTSERIAKGSFVTGGFDGARFRDSTGIVVTDIPTGRQQLWALWERPADLPDDAAWEIDEAEVTESVAELMSTHDVWRFNADPPYWVEPVGAWAGKWPCVEEWWTNRTKAMAYAVRNYGEALDSAAVAFVDDDMEPRFAEHMAAAGRRDVNLWDDQGQRLFILEKLHPDRRFDAQMAAVLSWEARLEAIRQGAKPTPKRRSTKFGRLDRR